MLRPLRGERDMRIRISHVLVIVALVAVAIPAFAQPGGGPGRGEGRERGGNMGRMQPGMQMGAQVGVMLLVNPQVQTELKLTEEQRRQIQDIVARAREEMRPEPGQRPGAGGQRPGAGGQRPGQGGIGANMERYTEEAMRVLQPNQRERFEQIQLRVQGVRALGRDEIAEKVGLTSDQRQQIREILRENMGGRDGARPNPGEWNPQEMRAQMEERRQENERRILQVLTAEQKAKWESLLGAPFELRPQPRG